ncbi:hypothetical protein JCM4814A_36580 [Streptomyces phaeofaciens JCM 4814]|uniref:Uncharacterized protein n=1 Tax=Streptomyces phaeofaciens TaxID=68254 RepID=A0A918HGK1_9ACTN|nr:hypothetical protein GCM10010226_40980 [Streptomyces phaeofaciens]
MRERGEGERCRSDDSADRENPGLPGGDGRNADDVAGARGVHDQALTVAMPTCSGTAAVPSVKIRSPGRRASAETGLPSLTCVYVVRVRGTPAALYACCIKEEQSHRPIALSPWESVQVPPHWYGVPRWSSAHRIAVWTSRGAVAGMLYFSGSAPAGMVPKSVPSPSAAQPPVAPGAGPSGTGDGDAPPPPPPVFGSRGSMAFCKAVAIGSHFAYASGKPDFCTAWAACVTDRDCQPETCRSPS